MRDDARVLKGWSRREPRERLMEKMGWVNDLQIMLTGEPEHLTGTVGLSKVVLTSYIGCEACSQTVLHPFPSSRRGGGGGGGTYNRIMRVRSIATDIANDGEFPVWLLETLLVDEGRDLLAEVDAVDEANQVSVRGLEVQEEWLMGWFRTCPSLRSRRRGHLSLSRPYPISTLHPCRLGCKHLLHL